MSAVFFLLDFFIPLFFLLLGRCFRGRTGRMLVRESLHVFCAVLLFAPVGMMFFPLSVQGGICAIILLVQTFSVCFKAEKCKVKK